MTSCCFCSYSHLTKSRSSKLFEITSNHCLGKYTAFKILLEFLYCIRLSTPTRRFNFDFFLQRKSSKSVGVFAIWWTHTTVTAATRIFTDQTIWFICCFNTVTIAFSLNVEKITRSACLFTMAFCQTKISSRPCLTSNLLGREKS